MQMGPPEMGTELWPFEACQLLKSSRSIRGAKNRVINKWRNKLGKLKKNNSVIAEQLKEKVMLPSGKHASVPTYCVADINF